MYSFYNRWQRYELIPKPPNLSSKNDSHTVAQAICESANDPTIY